jgi:hypothetical protein
LLLLCLVGCWLLTAAAPACACSMQECVPHEVSGGRSGDHAHTFAVPRSLQSAMHAHAESVLTCADWSCCLLPRYSVRQFAAASKSVSRIVAKLPMQLRQLQTQILSLPCCPACTHSSQSQACSQLAPALVLRLRDAAAAAGQACHSHT